jgi:hypothetical protein
LHWLVEAAEQLKGFSASFLCNVHVKALVPFAADQSVFCL